MQVAMPDPGIVLYSLSSTEVLNLGLTSVSSDVSLSVRDLLEFVGSSYFFSAIRYLFFVFFWAQIKSVKCMVNVFQGHKAFPVKSKTGACDIYSIQECRWISSDCSRSVSNIVGSAAAALSPVGVVLF